MNGEASRAARAARAARRAERDRQRHAIEVEGDLDPPPKLGHSIRELVATAASVVHTRIALAGLELEEEIQRLLQAAIFALVAGIFAFLGLVVGTFAIVVAVAPEQRLVTMIVITIVYLAIGVVGFIKVKGLFEARPPIFGATFAELEKDKETLSQMVRVRRAAEQERAHRTSDDTTRD